MLAHGARRLLRRRMPVLPLLELRAALPAGQRLLGLDLGEKTIGIAVSDSLLSVATAVSTIQRKKFAPDLAALRQIMAERNVGGLVIGLPLNMDGSEGPRCQSVRQFARNLLVHGDLPIAFWDERMSTMAVTRPMIEADLRGASAPAPSIPWRQPISCRARWTPWAPARAGSGSYPTSPCAIAASAIHWQTITTKSGGRLPPWKS